MKIKLIATFLLWLGLGNAPFSTKSYADENHHPNPTKNIAVFLTNFETGAVSQASLTLNGFVPVNDGLIAVATLNGVTVQLPVAIFESTCQRINLNLGPARVELGNSIVDISKVDVDLTPISGNRVELPQLICETSALINARSQAKLTAEKFNTILQILE